MRIKLTDEQLKQNQLIATREWKARNRESIKQYNKIWNEANKTLKKVLKQKWDSENVSHRKEYAKQFKANNPDYYKRKHLQYSYGILLEEYEIMRESQKCRCYICGKHENDTNRKRLFVDHCHTTGKIRGLLCQQCNTALGMVNEDVDILFAMVSYLQEHEK